MNATNIQPSSTSGLPYAVLLEQTEHGNWIAQAVGWVACHAEGASRKAALESLQQLVSARFSRAEVVYLELPIAHTEHPWMKHAGMYENDPLFDEVLSEIAAYRQELDADREELAAEEW